MLWATWAALRGLWVAWATWPAVWAYSKMEREYPLMSLYDLIASGRLIQQLQLWMRRLISFSFACFFFSEFCENFEALTSLCIVFKDII